MANLYDDAPHNSIDDLRDSLTLNNIVTIRINYAAFSGSCWAHHTRRFCEYLATFCSKQHYPHGMTMSLSLGSSTFMIFWLSSSIFPKRLPFISRLDFRGPIVMVGRTRRNSGCAKWAWRFKYSNASYWNQSIVPRSGIWLRVFTMRQRGGWCMFELGTRLCIFEICCSTLKEG